MAHGYYIIASRSHGAYRLPLVGPFKSMGATLRMLDPVNAAVQRGRPDLHDCDILPAPLSVRGRLPAGALDLGLLDPQDVIRASARFLRD